MQDFLQKFFPDIYKKQQNAAFSNYCKFDSQLLQLFTSSLFLAAMLGGFLGAWTTGKVGRVKTMLVAGLCFLLGAGLCAGAVTIVMLVLGRIALGFGVGMANQVSRLFAQLICN